MRFTNFSNESDRNQAIALGGSGRWTWMFGSRMRSTEHRRTKEIIGHKCRVTLLVACLGSGDMAMAQPGPQGAMLIHVVPPISGVKILPNDTRLPGVPSNVLKITACRGEYEPASFVLRAIAGDIEGLILEKQDLVGAADSATIPAENVDIKVVKPWFQALDVWNEFRKVRPVGFRQALVPELLLNDDSLIMVDLTNETNQVRIEQQGKAAYVYVNQRKLQSDATAANERLEARISDSEMLQPFSLPRSTNKQIWVTVNVPETTPGGTYRGNIVLRSAQGTLGSIEVELTVPGFDLSDSLLTHSIYYRAQLDLGKSLIGSEVRSAELMSLDLLNMLHHGVRNPTMYQSLKSEGLFRQVLKLRQNLAMNDAPLYLVGIQTTATLPELGDLIPRARSIAANYGFGDIYVYGKDEAKGPELAAQRAIWREVHRMGAKIFVAGFDDSHEAVGDLLDMLVHARQPNRREALKWHASGHKIFNYLNPQSGPENPLLFRLNFGLLLWANEYDGAMPYAYQHCFGSCWNDLDHDAYRDHNLTYPTASGPIDTIAWEGFREAVDDTRYVATLENKLRKSEGSNSEATRHAKAYLSSLRSRLIALQERSGAYNQDMTIDLNAVRREVVTLINGLSQ